MNTSDNLLCSATPPSPYSAARTRHRINFFCHAPAATFVSLIGDFNRWQPNANPMCKMPDGSWMASLELPHGHHQYLFLVDGKPTLDLNAHGTASKAGGERVSLVAVS